MLSKSNKYIRIDSDFFQDRLSALLELFEDHEDKERYALAETYEPLEVKPLEPEHRESFDLLPMRKRDLTKREKRLIEKYLCSLTIEL
jgi:hypothetical protein